MSKQKANKEKNNLSTLDYILIGTFILSFLIIFSQIFDPKIDLGGDNAQYYILGKALSLGEGYTNLNSPSMAPNNHYPPGYPAIIGLLLFIFPDSIELIKVFNGIFLLASCYFIYYIFLKITDLKILSVGVTFFLLFNTHLLKYSTIMMSEIAYLLMTSISIFFFLKSDWEKHPLKNKAFLGSLLFLAAAYYIRTLGISLVFGFLVYLIIYKNWKYVISLVAGFVLLILPWTIRTQMLGGSSYINQFKRVNVYRPELGEAGLMDFVNRIFTNFERYITKEIPNGLFPINTIDYRAPATTFDWVIGILIVGILIFGLIQLKNHRWLIIAYFVGIFGVLMLWPQVWVGVRFMLPVIPFLMIVFFNGIFHLIAHFINVKSAPGVTLAAIIILALVSITSIKNLSLVAKSDYPDNWKNYFKIAEWANQNLDSEVIICCRKPYLFYLESGTFTVNYKSSEVKREVIDDLEDKSVDYLVLDNLGYRQTYTYLYPAVQEYQNRFQVAIKLNNPDTYLLKFSK